MEKFAREDVRAVLATFGVSKAQLASPMDATEEIILLDADDLASIDVQAATIAIMNVMPHMRIWVTANGPRWKSEPL
jgi:hypothetical protein